jgi:transposase
MAKRFVTVDRDTPLLMPPTIQEWVAEDDMARFIVDAVSVVDESSCKINWRGSGSEQYPPRMMLALLIYCYANGVFSSRRIQRATYRDIAVRFITGDTHPDHDTIASFRRENGVLFKACFTKVLSMAREMKIRKVGEISVDGSKIEANASKKKVLTKEHIETQIANLEKEVTELMAKAEQTDELDAKTVDGSRLPQELCQKNQRLEAMRLAMKQLEEKTSARSAQRAAEREAFDRDGPGEPPRALPDKPSPTDTIHPVDPDARLMPMKKGGHAPGYNVQIAVQADTSVPLILASDVVDETSDRRQLQPMAEKALEAQPETSHIHVDTGYDNSSQIYQIESKHHAIVYCPPEKSARATSSSRQSAARKATMDYREGMKSCMKSERGKISQRLRATTVEPVFGWIKNTLRFTRFHLRGLAKVKLEWELICLAHNIQLLHRHQRRERA